MLKSDWENIERLAAIVEKTNATPMARHSFGASLAATRKEDEHPEWYDGPCECAMCRSYADE